MFRWGMRVQLRNVVLVSAIFSCGQAHAGDWNVGLKHLTLPDPVSGSSMTGIVTYPTMAPATRLKIGRFETVMAENAPELENSRLSYSLMVRAPFRNSTFGFLKA